MKKFGKSAQQKYFSFEMKIIYGEVIKCHHPTKSAFFQGIM